MHGHRCGARRAVRRSLRIGVRRNRPAAPSFLAGTWQGTVTIDGESRRSGWTPRHNGGDHAGRLRSCRKRICRHFGRRSSQPICGCRSPRSPRPRSSRRIHRPRISAPKAITTLHVAAEARSAAPERRRRRESTRTLRAWTVAPDSQDASCSPSNEVLMVPVPSGARQLS